MKKIIISILSVILVCILAACSGSSNDSDTGKEKKDNTLSAQRYITSQEQFIRQTSFGTYVFYLDLSSTDEELDTSDLSTFYDHIILCSDGSKFSVENCAQDGDEFYGRFPGDPSNFYHFTVVDTTTAEKEVWVSRERLAEIFFAGDDDIDWRPITLENFLADGDSVYATFGYQLEHMDSQVELNGRIARISKDGDTIELVGDDSIRAREYVVRDGWIYYVDNGYTVNGNAYDYDSDKVGLYKVRTDGTEKTLLRGGSVQSERVRVGNAGDLALCDDYLYFLDMSEGASVSYPARIKLDGTGYERLSDTSASVYTLDTENQILYFETGEYGKSTSDKKNICRLPLDSLKEEKVRSTSESFSMMTFCDGQLYYFDSPDIKGDTTKYCYRTDPESGITEQLTGRKERTSTLISWTEVK